MKKVFLLILCTSLFGCSLNYDTSYFITNRTVDTISFTFYNMEPDTLRFKVKPFSDYLFLRTVGFGFRPSEMSLDYNDSIIAIKNEKKIIYYRSDASRNEIFLLENWKLTKALKSVYEYKFAIEESDFK